MYAGGNEEERSSIRKSERQRATITSRRLFRRRQLNGLFSLLFFSFYGILEFYD